MTDDTERPDTRPAGGGGVDGANDESPAPEEEQAAADEPVTNDDSDAAEQAVEFDLAAILSERDSFKDIALRLQADFENYKKRVLAQRADEVDRATGRLAEALLPVLDAAEAAFLAHPAEVEPLYNVLLGELRKQGLEAMNLHEQPFDPTVADAVVHEPGDEVEPIVSEVLRTGYLWKGKVLRPAMVKVRG